MEGFNDSFSMLFECPVCADCMTEAKTFCCEGHSFCSKCCSVLSNCPTCRSSKSLQTNRTLEAVAHEIQKRTIFASIQTQTDFFSETTLSTISRTFECPYERCPEPSVSMEKLVRHIFNTPHHLFIRGTKLNSDVVEIMLLIRFNTTIYFKVVRGLEQFFVLRYHVDMKKSELVIFAWILNEDGTFRFSIDKENVYGIEPYMKQQNNPARISVKKKSVQIMKLCFIRHSN